MVLHFPSLLLVLRNSQNIRAYFWILKKKKKKKTFNETSFLRSRYDNATPNLFWLFCALLGVLCN